MSREDTGVVVPVVYEVGGTPRLEQVLASVRHGSSRVWDWVVSLATRETDRGHPYFMEFDLAGAIYYRELAEDRVRTAVVGETGRR